MGTLGGFLHTVPLAVWLALVGILGTVVTALVNYYLGKAQAKSQARRDAEQQKLALEKQTALTRADLLARVRFHCATLRAAVARGSIDLVAWRGAHDELLRRARQTDVIATLGPKYVEFMDVLHSEGLAVSVQRGSGNDREHDANLTVENVADVALAYAPFLRTFGESDDNVAGLVMFAENALKAAREQRRLRRP
ncbi:MAG: hypothetical protein ACLPYS_19530 [Vulcanimicrobiaceae bacterium]